MAFIIMMKVAAFRLAVTYGEAHKTQLLRNPDNAEEPVELTAIIWSIIWVN